MEYIKQITPQEEVNKKNSRIWVQMNDNSRAEFCRNEFVKKYGGFFKKDKKDWIWISPEKESNGYWLENINTKEKVFFTNMTDFGKKHGLTPVKICELLNGKRKTYKGWTAVELREIKEGTGQHFKKKEPKPKKIAVPRSVVLQDITTGQIIPVPNIKQFAKDNGIFPANLYKLVNGKYKTVKNLKLYNPLDN
jgi:hypothetical protein